MKHLLHIALLPILLVAPLLCFAELNTFRCELKSHDDSLSFTISDPMLPKPVIIGANGGNPLKKIAELVTPNREILIVLVEEFAFGEHITNLVKQPSGFKAVHLRFSNPDPKAGFYGKCLPL